MTSVESSGNEVQRAETLLNRLNDIHFDVLDRAAISQATSKEIARDLGISPDTVDQRFATIRRVLGTQSRRDAIRVYLELKSICGQTVYGPLGLSQSQLPRDPVFEERPSEEGQFPLLPVSFLETLDARFSGPKGRIYAILGIFAGLLLLLLVATAVLQQISNLLPASLLTTEETQTMKADSQLLIDAKNISILNHKLEDAKRDALAIQGELLTASVRWATEAGISAFEGRKEIDRQVVAIKLAADDLKLCGMIHVGMEKQFVETMGHPFECPKTAQADEDSNVISIAVA